MPEVKKAHCPAPDLVVTACRTYAAATHAPSPAKGSAVLISEGIELLAEARRDAPKLVEVCRSKYPRFGGEISAHIPSSVREQARHLKRVRAFASLQDLYLEAILKGLTKHGFLGPDLEPAPAPERAGG